LNNYIKTNDPETIASLEKLGFKKISENAGFVTFLNDQQAIKKYANDKMVYALSNKLEL
jgi:hypothetical protein